MGCAQIGVVGLDILPVESAAASQAHRLQGLICQPYEILIPTPDRNPKVLQLPTTACFRGTS